jgi:hypothetical protein
MKAVRITLVLVAVVAGVVAVPKETGAHCLPGDIHMHGTYGYDEIGFYDTGCVYVGTQAEGCYNDWCKDWDAENGYCNVWYWHCDYNCDGC